jgi:hypothetical protein
MTKSLLATYDMTIDECNAIMDELRSISATEIIMLNQRGYKDYNEYILWNVDADRVYHVGEFECSYPKAKNSWAVINKRREEYYQTATWILRRNILLSITQFICAGCGGLATQAHHQDWSKKFGNYAKIGLDEELDVLVPVCNHCHQCVTNIQNEKRWHTKPRPYAIKLDRHPEFNQIEQQELL